MGFRETLRLFQSRVSAAWTGSGSGTGVDCVAIVRRDFGSHKGAVTLVSADFFSGPGKPSAETAMYKITVETDPGLPPASAEEARLTEMERAEWIKRCMDTK